VADEVVQTLAEKYPEIRGMRNEMVSTISQELSVEGSTESSGDFETGERLLSSGGSEFEPRTELEKIVALENYMEWRKDTMTRRQANKAKGIVDEIVRLPPPARPLALCPFLFCTVVDEIDAQDFTGEDSAAGSLTLDPKKTGQQFKAISHNVRAHLFRPKSHRY
jgi:hypothetical protein